MSKVILFGGTTEGRRLCEICAEIHLPVIYCVATEDGARPALSLSNVEVRVGRMEAVQMAKLLQDATLVVDATHPYAQNASRNIAVACQTVGVPLLCVKRERNEEQDCMHFNAIGDMITWLQKEQGSIFATIGSSYAAAFCRLADYQRRVWMRILPSMDSLGTCLKLGYRPDRLICMQGPFSEELNRTMFRVSGAKILVTKNTGSTGGFPEKVRAAKSLGMLIAVLLRPEESDGVSLEEAAKKLMELRK